MNKTKTEKEPKFWWHKDSSLKHSRFWIHIFKFCINPEWCFGTDLRNLGFGIKLDMDEDAGIQFKLNLIFAHFYLTIENILTHKYCKKKIIDQKISSYRIIELEIFHDMIMWSLLLPIDIYGTYYPQDSIRSGTFNYFNFLFGKDKYSEEEVEKREVILNMKEGQYYGTGRKFISYWTRPRWFTKKITRCEIEFPEGVPHPGKGTAAHNCDDDCTYSLTCPSNSISESLLKFQKDILYKRENYPL